LSITGVTGNSITYTLGGSGQLPADVSYVYVWVTTNVSDITNKVVGVVDSILVSNLGSPQTKTGLNGSTKYYIGVIPRDGGGTWADSVLLDSTSTEIHNPVTLVLSQDADLEEVYVDFLNSGDISQSVENVYIYYRTGGFVTDPFTASDTVFTRAEFVSLPSNRMVIRNLTKGTYYFSMTLGIGAKRSQILNPTDSIYVNFLSPPNIFSLVLQPISTSQIDYFLPEYNSVDDTSADGDTLIDSAVIFLSTDSLTLASQYKTNPGLVVRSLYKDTVKYIVEFRSILGLSEGTLYFVGVSTRNRAGNWSKSINIFRQYTSFTNPLGLSVDETAVKGDSGVVVTFLNLAQLHSNVDSIKLFFQPTYYKTEPNNLPDRMYSKASLLANSSVVLGGFNSNTLYYFTASCGNSLNTTGYAPIDPAVNGDTVRTGDYSPPSNAMGFQLTSVGDTLVEFSLSGTPGVSVESLFVYLSLDSNILSRDFRTLPPSFGFSSSDFSGSFSIDTLSDGTDYYLGVALKSLERIWSDSVNIVGFRTLYTPPVNEIVIDTVWTVGRFPLENKIYVAWHWDGTALPSRVKFLYGVLASVSDTPGVHNQGGFDSVGFTPGVLFDTTEIPGLSPTLLESQTRYVVSGYVMSVHGVWSLGSVWDTIRTQNPDDVDAPDMSVYNLNDLALDVSQVDVKTVRLSWTLDAASAAAAQALEGGSLRLGYDFRSDNFDYYRNTSLPYTYRFYVPSGEFVSRRDTVIGVPLPKTLYYFGIAPVDSVSNRGPAFDRSLDSFATVVPPFDTGEVVVYETGFSSFVVNWRNALSLAGDSLVFSADTHVKYISIVAQEGGFHGGALPSQDVLNMVGTRFMCATYPVSVCSVEVTSFQLNLGAIYLSVYSSVDYHAFSSEVLLVDSVSYVLDRPVLDSFSLFQVSDSLIRVRFLVSDATEDTVVFGGKLLTYLEPGHILRESVFPFDAVDTSFVNLSSDTVVVDSSGWLLQEGYIRLNSDGLDSSRHYIGTDTSVLRLKLELSDLVPTPAFDTFFIDSVVIDRRGPDGSLVGIDFERSTVTMSCSVWNDVGGELYRIYWGPDSLDLVDSLDYPSSGQTVPFVFSGYDSIYIRLVDTFFNVYDTSWADFVYSRIPLGDYIGDSVLIDNGIVALLVDSSSSSNIVSFGAHAFMEVRRVRLDGSDSLYFEGSGFSSYLPFKYQFFGEIEGSSVSDSISLSGLGLRYTYDTLLHGFDGSYGFYVLRYDTLGNVFSEYLGGVSGVDSFGLGYVYLEDFRVLSGLDSYMVVIGRDAISPVFEAQSSFIDFRRLDSSVVFLFKVHDNTVDLDGSFRVFTFDDAGGVVVLLDTSFVSLRGVGGLMDTVVVCSVGLDSVVRAYYDDIVLRGVYGAVVVDDGRYSDYLYLGDTLMYDTLSGELKFVKDRWSLVSFPWDVTSSERRDIVRSLETFKNTYDRERFRLYGSPGSGDRFREYEEDNSRFRIRQGLSHLMIVRYSDDVTVEYLVENAILRAPKKRSGYEFFGTGWHLLSVPFYGEVKLSSLVRSSKSSVVSGPVEDPANWRGRIWRLNRDEVFERFSSLDDVLPGVGEGFLVYLFLGDTLVFPVVNDNRYLPSLSKSPVSKSYVQRDDDWSLLVSLWGVGKGRFALDNLNSFGVCSRGSFSLPDVVFPGSAYRFGFLGSDGLRCVDTRKNDGRGHVWDVSVRGVSGGGDDLELCFGNLLGVPSDYLVYLDNPVLGYSVDLRKSGGIYRFYGESHGVQRFSVLVGDSAFVLSRISKPLPLVFGLNAARPNPFNPATVICYQVPDFMKGGPVGKSRLVLDIFDIQGRQVVRLEEHVARPGYHRVKWHGRDRSGRAVASGLYLYRLTVTDHKDKLRFNKTRKMMLVK
jgi:hypothetical protein